MQQAGSNFLKLLATSAKERVARGFYEVDKVSSERRSLKGAILRMEKVPIIAEVKFRSPLEGPLTSAKDVSAIASAYERGGASGVSVLTDPDHFDGRMEYISTVKNTTGLPVLMKDVVVDPSQIVAGGRAGADAILLIAGLFGKEGTLGLADAISYAHREGMEVLLEVHDAEEYDRALKVEADIVGINNRNLRTLEVSLGTSAQILGGRAHEKPVICESGIKDRTEIEQLLDSGADGFLIGSALMKSSNPEGLLRELVAR